MPRTHATAANERRIHLSDRFRGNCVHRCQRNRSNRKKAGAGAFPGECRPGSMMRMELCVPEATVIQSMEAAFRGAGNRKTEKHERLMRR